MRKLLLATIFLLFISTSTATAIPFSDVYVFGPSYVDSGNIPHPALYYEDRASNGPNLADRIAQHYGLTAEPSEQGGTNYAYGGARSSDVLLQTNQIVSDYGTLDSNALYIVFPGVWDVLDAFADLNSHIDNDPNNPILRDTLDESGIQSYYDQAINNAKINFDSTFSNLADNGARNFLILNMIDAARHPRFSSDPNASELTTNIEIMNSRYLDIANNLSANPLLDVTFFDTYSLANQMYANPGAFGFTNITDPSLIDSNGDNILGNIGDDIVPNPDEYFYWDLVHPTTRWHEIVAGEAIAALGSQPIPEPIAIDIKPNSCPNPLNVKSKGVIPVAVLGTADFDVSLIDITTLTLEGISPVENKNSIEDVAALSTFDPCGCEALGPDSHQDLTLNFDKQAIIATLGAVVNGEDIPLTLTGELTDGTAIEGLDCVVIKVK